MESKHEDESFCLMKLLKLSEIINKNPSKALKYKNMINLYILGLTNGNLPLVEVNTLKAALLELDSKVAESQSCSRNSSIDSLPNSDGSSCSIKIESVVSLAQQSSEEEEDYDEEEVIMEPPEKKPKIDIMTPPKNPEFTFSNQLRPWTGENELKSTPAIENMLKIECLYDMFKCMKSNCDFHTNDKNTFENHLNDHAETSSQQIGNFSRCSYCKFASLSVRKLMIHIVWTHVNDKFGCRYCFYRSVSPTSVEFHSRFYHSDKPQEILQHEISYFTSEFNFYLELQAANAGKLKYVSSLGIYGNKIYTFEEFFKQLREKFPEMHKILCRRCNKILSPKEFYQHFVSCNKIFPFHCIYCKYGSLNSFDVKLHLIDNHAEKLPLFCQRIQIKNSDPSSIECLPLINLERL